MSALTEHVRIMERAGRKVCKYCDSGNVAKKGTRKTKAGAVRLLKCCDCGRKFAYNPGFEKKRVDQKTITRAVKSYYQGMSVRDIAADLESEGTGVSHKTIYN